MNDTWVAGPRKFRKQRIRRQVEWGWWLALGLFIGAGLVLEYIALSYANG